MKLFNTILLGTFLTFFAVSNVACSTSVDNLSFTPQSDSIDLMREFSLFYEAHKNSQFEQWTLDRGWNVINTDPSKFVRYKPFLKMEEIIFFLHDSVETTTDEEKIALADTVLYLYDVAAEYDKERTGYYLARKAYTLEVWQEADPEIVIAAYAAALGSGSEVQAQYKDRYGLALINNASDDNDYKLKALDLYSALSEEEPDNARWIMRIESLAENIEELVDITKKSWDLSRENTEKAWKYASVCIRAQEYQKAIEPLEFLTQKMPEVINYWKQLATVYDKNGMSDKSINANKTLIELQPDNRDNYVNIALTYKKLGQLSVARQYLRKAANADPSWDYPYYIEGSLYEQAVRECMSAKLEFEDKVVFQLAVNTYRHARNIGGAYATTCAERISALSNSVPQQDDYFFRNISPGTEIKIEKTCYRWINKSITAP